MLSNLPSVSIIIPTYNRSKYILEAINSAKAQTYSNYEIIVVDDGSCDNTKDILINEVGIQYFYKENGGQASARNFGLKHAKGEIIASLDSDDIWDNHFLEILVKKLINDRLDYVFAHYSRVLSDTQSVTSGVYNLYLMRYFDRIEDNWIDFTSSEIRELYINTCPSPSTSFVIRREALQTGWNEKMKIGDDWFMQLSAILAGYTKCSFYVEPLWIKRVNNNNVYDERDAEEVCMNLNIHDIGLFLKTFESKIDRKERQILRNHRVQGYVGVALINISQKKLYAKGIKAILLSLNEMFFETSKRIFNIMYRVVCHRLGLQK